MKANRFLQSVFLAGLFGLGLLGRGVEASGTGGHGGNDLAARIDADFLEQVAAVSDRPALKDLIPKVLAQYRQMEIVVVRDWKNSSFDRYVRIPQSKGVQDRIEVSELLATVYKDGVYVDENKVSFHRIDSLYSRSDTIPALFGLISKLVLDIPLIPQEMGLREVLGAECFLYTFPTMPRAGSELSGHFYENFPYASPKERQACAFFRMGYEILAKSADLGVERFPLASDLKAFLPTLLGLRLRVVSKISRPALISDALSDPNLNITWISAKALESYQVPEELWKDSQRRLPTHELLVLAAIDGDNHYRKTDEVIRRARAGIPKCGVEGFYIKEKDFKKLYLYQGELLTVPQQVEKGLLWGGMIDVAQAVSSYCFDRATEAAKRERVECPEGFQCEWSGIQHWIDLAREKLEAPGVSFMEQFKWKQLKGASFLEVGSTMNEYVLSSDETRRYWAVNNARCKAEYVGTKHGARGPTEAEKCDFIKTQCRPSFIKNPNLIAADLEALNAIEKSLGCP